MMVYRNGNDKSKYQKKKRFQSIAIRQKKKWVVMGEKSSENMKYYTVYCTSALNQLHNMQNSQ